MPKSIYHLLLIAGLALLSPFCFALDVINTEADGVEYIMLSGTFDDVYSHNLLYWGFRTDELILDRALKNVLNKNSPVAIMITSEGGSREVAQAIGRALNRFSEVYFKKYRQPLVTGLIGQCPSACTFLAATLTAESNQRHHLIMTPADTPFLFHGPVDNETGAPLSREDFESHLANGLQQYRDSGINPKWLNKNRAIFRRTGKGQTVRARSLCGNSSGFLPPNACKSSYSEIERQILQLAHRFRR